MSVDSRKKEKRRLKREKKKAHQRRESSQGPYRRIGEVGQTHATYINADWQTHGIAMIYVVRRAPGGGYAVAGFDVDLWCAGLRDAWGHVDISLGEFEKHLAAISEKNNTELIRVDQDWVKRLLGGAIRFTVTNGFRLPDHYERWIAMIGGADSVASDEIDRTLFGKDGKLFWCGPLSKLRSRLVGSTVEEFLARPDVEYIAEVEGDNPDFYDLNEDSEFDDEDDEDSEFDDDDDQDDLAAIEEAALSNGIIMLKEVARRLQNIIVQKMKERGEVPLARIKEACQSMVVLAMVEPLIAKSKDGFQIDDVQFMDAANHANGGSEVASLDETKKFMEAAATKLMNELVESGDAQFQQDMLTAVKQIAPFANELRSSHFLSILKEVIGG